MRSTIAMRFVDTNVLLYAVSTNRLERAKCDTARSLLEAEDLALSTQVLQEFYVQATRSSRPDPLRHEQAANLVEAWLRFRVQAITVEVMQCALSTHQRWGLSYWDAAIVESARMLQCDVLLTEDLQNGMNFAGVRVVNPFR